MTFDLLALTDIIVMSFDIWPFSAEYHQVHQWLQKLAIEQNIEDASTSRQLVSLFLKLSRQTKTLPQVLRNICQDIHSQLGDIDQDTTGDFD